MTTSKPIFWAKWILYVAAVLAPIALVIFPNFFVFTEDRIKVVVSLLGFLVLGLVFALVLNVAGPRESKEPGVYEWT